MVKLEGKAFGIVQLVNRSEGLEAWRQLKLEYEEKSGNRQAALLRGILKPKGCLGGLPKKAGAATANRGPKVTAFFRPIFASTVFKRKGVPFSVGLGTCEGGLELPTSPQICCARKIMRPGSWVAAAREALCHRAVTKERDVVRESDKLKW